MERYRSGHNGPDSKSGDGQPSVGSNPTRSAHNRLTVISLTAPARRGLSFFQKCIFPRLNKGHFIMLIPHKLQENGTSKSIFINVLLAAISLFFNGFGVYLTIHANIGAGPWDVLNLGLSKSTGMLYGNASVTVSFTILIIDILMREPIGLAIFIDAVVVGKSVDFFNMMNLFPEASSLLSGIPMMLAGLVVIAYTQYTYMMASLGCGPRDTLLVGLAKRISNVPIGIVSIALLSLATFIGWLLGGPVGIGTLISAFGAGPIMQLAFQSVHFDATTVRHQRLKASWNVICTHRA